MTHDASHPAHLSHSTHKETQARSSRPSKKARLGGLVLSGLGVLFLTFDATLKVIQSPQASEATSALGYPTEALFCLGLLQLALLILYVVPRTALLGAVLWVGYLGGAVAIHTRVQNPLWSHTLFPVYVALLLWGGLALRDLRVRALLRDLFAPNRGDT